MKIKIQFSDFLWFVCGPRSLSAAAFCITCSLWLNYLTFLLECHCLKSSVLTLGFFACRFFKDVVEGVSISLYAWETDTKLNEKNDYCVLLLPFKRESVTTHANNCLHFSLNFVNEAGVKCQLFTSTASNIIGNICNLVSRKLCCSAVVVSFKCTHTFVLKLGLGFHQKSSYLSLAVWGGDLEQKVTSLKFFLFAEGRGCSDRRISVVWRTISMGLSAFAAVWVAELVSLPLCNIFSQVACKWYKF